MTSERVFSEISVNEFIFDLTDSLFHSRAFFELYASEGDVFLELKTGHGAGVACYFNQSNTGKWCSPVKGTFAGPICIGKVADSDYAYAIDLFEQYLRSNGAVEICYSLPPMYFAPGLVSRSHYLLQSRGYINYRTDLNYHLTVSDQPFEKILSSSKRKGLKNSAMQELRIQQINDAEFDKLYSLLQLNRKALGADLSMSKGQLCELKSNFPNNIFMVGTYFENELISGAFCIRLNRDVLYVFYWGHLPNSQIKNPILPMAKFIYEWSQQRKISFLDLGTSTVGKQTNWNLMFFKKSLGATETIKCRFRKSWSKK